MLEHLPILSVVIPLLVAPICLLFRSSYFAWLCSLMASGIVFLISALLLSQVIDSGAIDYTLGGWEAPWGIAYRIDVLSAFLLIIISGTSSAILFAAQSSIKKEIPQERHVLFYVLYLLSLAGMMGIVATGDAFNAFVFLEISSLSAYSLIALGKERRALWAAFQYLIMGTIGATLILIGIGLMYQMTGTLNMEDLSNRLPNVAQTRTVFAAYVFVVVGVCLKLALFPLHQWLPNAYAYAPSIVTAFFSATTTKVAMYLLIRFTFSIFGVSFAFSTLPLQNILITLGVLGVIVASTVAIYQSNVKHVFAYSSVAQIGYMIIGFSINTTAGLMATLLHIFNHALMKSALFLALGAVMYRIGSVQLSDFQGLGRKMPFTMAAIVIGGLSLIGVPLTVGFISKWYLIVAALENAWWPVAVIMLFGSLLAIIYVWRIVEIAYLKEPIENGESVQEAPFAILFPIWLLIAANIYFGIDTRLSILVAETVSASLLG